MKFCGVVKGIDCKNCPFAVDGYKLTCPDDYNDNDEGGYLVRDLLEKIRRSAKAIDLVLKGEAFRKYDEYGDEISN